MLVVDDEPAVRAVACAMLERAGYRAMDVEGGEQALDLLRSLECRIDAVILDLTMPGMSGKDTLVALRRLRPEMPVICCSGFGNDVGAGWVEGKERTKFVAKPFTGERLCESLRRILDSPS